MLVGALRRYSGSAGSGDSGLLDEIAADVERQLPLIARVREASLFVEDEHARWREHSRLLLRDAA